MIRKLEPITWASLGVAAAEGAAAYLGGRILASVLGDRGLNADDVRKIVAAAVADLKSYVSSVLDQQTINEANDKIVAGYDLLRQYSTNRSSRHRLHSADLSASEAMATTKRFGEPALTAFVSATSLKLLCSAALIRSCQSRERINYRGIVSESSTYALAATDSIRSAWTSKIKNVTPVIPYKERVRDKSESHDGPDGPPDRPSYTERRRWRFTDNGRVIILMEEQRGSGAKAEAQRQEIISGYQANLDGFESNVGDPIRKIVDTWKSTRKSLPNFKAGPEPTTE